MNIEKLYEYFLESNQQISTDTRTLKSGDMYFAWRGESSDGNDYVEEAFEKGASYAIVDREDARVNERCIFVEDGMKALQDLAHFHRKKLNIPIIGLTGSNGKTTTKELIAAVLKTEKKVLATKGNLNNHVGIPKTLLSIKHHHEIAIIEMGANHVGEIAELCRIAEPTHGLITNVGRAHIGFFGSEENIFRGKTELYRFLEKNNGTIFVNNEDLKLLRSANSNEKITYLGKDSDYPMNSLKTLPKVSVSFSKGKNIKTQLTGEYNIPNISAAIALGKYFLLSDKNIIFGIENYKPDNKRSEIVEGENNNTYIKDYYNANYSSMELALANLAEIEGEKNKIAILGDMFELGDYEYEDHLKISQLAASFNFSKVILVGKAFSELDIEGENIFQFKTTDEAIDFYKKENFKNSYILFKASNGMDFKKFFKNL